MQEKLVLKDFNIAKEAGGVGLATVKTFPVTINDGKLQIRLYWAGKGTVSVPDKVFMALLYQPYPLIQVLAINQKNMYI